MWVCECCCMDSAPSDLRLAIVVTTVWATIGPRLLTDIAGRCVCWCQMGNIDKLVPGISDTLRSATQMLEAASGPKRRNATDSKGTGKGKSEGVAGVTGPTMLPVTMPAYTAAHISKVFGVRAVVQQTCWDIVYNLEVVHP